MSRRLLQRQSSSSMDVDRQNPPTMEGAFAGLLMRKDGNNKKTSETKKLAEAKKPEPKAPVVQESLPTYLASPQPNMDILSLSPVISSPGSTRSNDDEPENGSLLNQLQVRRSRPEHSPSDLSPNFSPSFSPRFVPTSRPRTLLAYLQNFGQHNLNQAATSTQSQTTQGDPRRTANLFFSRIFGNNPPVAPQTSFGNSTQSTNTDEAVPTTTEVQQYQPQHQITNTISNFPHGAIIVRTVQPGTDGSVVVNMRVLSLDDLLNQQANFDDSTNSGLFGGLLNVLAGLQNVPMFTISNMGDFITQTRGLDRHTINSLPAVTYGEEAFKNVDSESKKCTICLDTFGDGDELRYLWCLHRFHKGCVDQWLDKHSNCPVCKKDYIEGQNVSE